MAEDIDALSDPGRLAALREADLLGTAPEEEFDELTRIAAELLGAPVALVSLVDRDRQFFKSRAGDLPEPFREGAPLSHSFCKHAVGSGEALAIGDAREHPLVRDNPAVRELGAVAYLGIPLVVPPGGHALGTLCVFDTVPRRWDEAQVGRLRTLAAAVTSAIVYRMRRAEALRLVEGREADARSLLAAAAALAKAAAAHLDHPEAGGGLGEAVRGLRRRLDDASEDPRLRHAAELCAACEAYLEAEGHRAQAGERLGRLRAGLEELEWELGAAASLAENALRLALGAHVGRRPG